MYRGALKPNAVHRTSFSGSGSCPKLVITHKSGHGAEWDPAERKVAHTANASPDHSSPRRAIVLAFIVAAQRR